jgi:cell wall assembly regulator SMI1
MDELWQRIAAWFAIHAPPDPYFFSLAPGATAASLEAKEVVLGFRLPEDVRESYLVHDGNNDTAVFGNQIVLSLQEIVRNWQIGCKGLEMNLSQGLKPPELVGPIKDTWWHVRWVPITDDGSGDHICIDMDPAPGGCIGQVIETNHEVGPLRVLASGFRQFLTQFADDLEAGKYWYDMQSMMVRKHGGYVPPGRHPPS